MSRAHNYNLSVHNQLDRSHVLTIKGMNMMCPGPDSTTAYALSIASIYVQNSRGGVLGRVTVITNNTHIRQQHVITVP